METNKRERKFYKRRILQLVKDMLSPDETPTTPSTDMIFAFDNFTRTCISYFKMIDRTDIIQTDYEQDEVNDTTAVLEEPPAFTLEETAKSMMRTITVDKITMDQFVKRTPTAPLKQQIIPLKREINLKDPELRNKGIRKKKNVEIVYDKTEDKNETEESKTVEKEIPERRVIENI